MAKGDLFKKCLGVRTLIQSSVELDQPINHYIAYDKESKEFEVTLFAQAQEAPVPFWTTKIMVQYKHLEKFLWYIFKLIDRYDRLLLSKPKVYAPPGTGGGKNGGVQRPK